LCRECRVCKHDLAYARASDTSRIVDDKWKMIISSAPGVHQTSGASPIEFFPQRCAPVSIETGCTTPRSRHQRVQLPQSPPESSSGLRLNPEQSRCNSPAADLRVKPLP